MLTFFCIRSVSLVLFELNEKVSYSYKNTLQASVRLQVEKSGGLIPIDR